MAEGKKWSELSVEERLAVKQKGLDIQKALAADPDTSAASYCRTIQRAAEEYGKETGLATKPVGDYLPSRITRLNLNEIARAGTTLVAMAIAQDEASGSPRTMDCQEWLLGELNRRHKQMIDKEGKAGQPMDWADVRAEWRCMFTFYVEQLDKADAYYLAHPVESTQRPDRDFFGDGEATQAEADEADEATEEFAEDLTP